ncbi:MAG: YihY/virulence factor BrkB family protein [Deltaproteobacteria bacterium]|nr:YihY/virulence factor BrkB family protein [Deltaproteobacteria bacterium]
MSKKRRISGRLTFLWAVLRKFDRDHGFFLSAGITFNLIICLIPLSLLLLALVGTYLYSAKEVLNHIRLYLEGVAPALDPKIMKNLLGIIQSRKIAGILGIIGLLWTSTWIFSSLRTAFNIIFQVKKGRGLFHGKVIDLLMIGLAGISHLVSMGLTSLMTYAQRYRIQASLDLGPIVGVFLKYLLPFLFTFWMFFLIYKIIPNRKIHFKTAFQTALYTSFFWEVAKQLFGWYVFNIGKFSMIYGPLSALIVFFFWVYYSSVIVLLGAEAVFLLEKGEEKVNG